jgi:hypothetical protein
MEMNLNYCILCILMQRTQLFRLISFHNPDNNNITVLSMLKYEPLQSTLDLSLRGVTKFLCFDMTLFWGYSVAGFVGSV